MSKNICQGCGTNKLPDNATACAMGDCFACEDCVCPDCHSCKFKHCHCDSDQEESSE